MRQQAADQPPAVDDRLPAQHPALLLARPPGEHRVEQRLLEVQRPHAVTEHPPELGVDVEGVLDTGRDDR